LAPEYNKNKRLLIHIFMLYELQIKKPLKSNKQIAKLKTITRKHWNRCKF